MCENAPWFRFVQPQGISRRMMRDECVNDCLRVTQTVGRTGVRPSLAAFTIRHAFDQLFQGGVSGGIRRCAVVARGLRMHVFRRC